MDRDPKSRAEGQEPASDPALAGTAVARIASDPNPEQEGRWTSPVSAPQELIASGMPPDPMPLSPGRFIKHYEIVRELGQGGMGSVFLARDTRLARLCAIKLLLAYTGEGAGRFLAEARATARCKHESIVVIYEVDEVRGYPYMVLEYLEGRTLRAWMNDRPIAPVPPSLAVELMIPVVRALACAHEMGIVHRDLKPENIVLTDAGQVKVLDFGVAKRIEVDAMAGAIAIASARGPDAGDPGLTREGALIGTLPYMSPEQWLVTDIDPQSDIWAAGILLYELITGSHPLAPANMGQLRTIQDLELPMPSVRERRPDVGALGAVIDRCLKKRKSERVGSARELLAELEPLLQPREAVVLGENESPFAGLSSFQEADAARFFGRDRDIAAVLGRLRDQQLVVVAGPSGAGKSSFVRAGVIPTLKRSEACWETFTLRPGRRPLAALADVLAQMSGGSTDGGASLPAAEDPDDLAATLLSRPGHLGARLRARCRRLGGDHRILLFVDQFEELYTLGTGSDERAAFLSCLEGVADDASSPLRVVISIRSDFLDKMAEDRHFMTEVTRGLVFLPAMGREGLRDALTRPVEAAGYRYEGDELCDQMLDALESTRSPLPLLQFTATQLWEGRDRGRRRLTRDSYRTLGGVAGALSSHADSVLAALSVPEQRLARSILLRLVTPERTRAIVSMTELGELAGGRDAPLQVVHYLAGARLLLIETGGDREGATVEIVHESLIDRWAKLRQWLDENEKDARFLARVRAAAQQWEVSEEAEGLLWRDRAAEDARQWLERRRTEQGASASSGLGKRDERYLLAVVALDERTRRRKRGIIVSAFANLGAIVVVVSLLAIRSNREAARADQQAALAEAAEQRATTRADDLTLIQARASLGRDPNASLAWLKALSPAFRRWGSVRTIAADAASRGIARVFRDHSAPVGAIEFSPDGALLVSVSDDRTVLLRDLRTGEARALSGHEDEVWIAAFSPDGKLLATGGKDCRVRLRDLSTGKECVLEGHEAGISYLSFSPDGKLLATRGELEKVRLWDVATGEGRVLSRADGAGGVAFSPDATTLAFMDEGGLVRLDLKSGVRSVSPGLPSGISEVAFSPDGTRIATAGGDGAVRLWNAATGASDILYHHTGGRVTSVAFSARGERVVSAGSDETVKIWDVAAGTLRTLTGHTGYIRRLTLSHDGTRIATAGGDGTVRLWDMATGEPRVFRGFAEGATWAAISPDGETVAGGGGDGTVRLWSLASRDLVSMPGPILRAAFSPDGRRVATLGEDGLIRVTTLPGLHILVLPGPATKPPTLPPGVSIVPGLKLSAGGEQVASVYDDGTVRVHRIAGGEPRVLRGHLGQALCIAFAPNGQALASGGNDGTVRLWDIATEEGRTLQRHGGEVTAIAFAPDGRSLASGGMDGVVRISDPATGTAKELRGHSGAVLSLVFSPDGATLVSGGNDRTIRLWDVASGQCIARDASGFGVRRLAFFPDGKSFASLGALTTVQLWDARTGESRGVLRGHTAPIAEMAVAADGQRLATGSVDGTVRLWDIASGESRVLGTCSSDGAAVAFGPDGLSVAAASFDGTVKRWADDLPADPAALRSWLAEATPETIDPQVHHE